MDFNLLPSSDTPHWGVQLQEAALLNFRGDFTTNTSRVAGFVDDHEPACPVDTLNHCLHVPRKDRSKVNELYFCAPHGPGDKRLHIW